MCASGPASTSLVRRGGQLRVNDLRQFATRKIAEFRSATYSGQVPLLRRILDLAPKYGVSDAELEAVNLQAREAVKDDSGLVVLARGKTSEKIVSGRTMIVTPFVGICGSGVTTQLGVGYIEESTGQASIWNLVGTNGVLQFLRAMKIVELIPEIGGSTLCHAYYAASINIHPSDAEHVGRVDTLIGRKVREAMAKATPKELYKVLQPLWELDLDFSSGALVELLEREDLAHGKEILLKMVEECLRHEWREEQRKLNEILPVAGVIDPSIHDGEFTAVLAEERQLDASQEPDVEVLAAAERPSQLVPTSFDTGKFSQQFGAFKAEVLPVIGQAYLLAIPHEALSVMERHARIMGVEVAFLFEVAPILAAVGEKVPEEILSIQAFRVETLSASLGRNLTDKECLALHLLTEEVKAAGYSGIKHLSEVPGVTIYYQDGRVVRGGETSAEVPRQAPAKTTGQRFKEWVVSLLPGRTAASETAGQASSQDLMVVEGRESIERLVGRADISVDFIKQLIEDGLMSIQVRRGRERNAVSFLTLLEYDYEHHLSGHGPGMVSFEMDKLSHFARLKRADFSGVVVVATEAFLYQNRYLLLEDRVVEVVPVPNPQPKTFQIPSALGEADFLTSEDDREIAQRISSVVRTALEKGTFLGDISFQQELSFSAYWVYTATPAGWIVDPARFLLSMSYIVVDEKMLDLGDHHLGYYYFDVRDNRFSKVVDRDDLAMLKNWRMFHTDMTMYATKTIGGEVTIHFD